MSKSAITFQPDRWPGCEVDYTIGFLDHANTAVDLHLLAHIALRQLSDTILPIRKRQERLAELSDEPKAKLVDRRINAVLGHLYDAIAEMGKSYE